MASRSGRYLDPTEMKEFHECLLTHDAVRVDDDMRILVEENWPELVCKLIPERLH